jgi:hypothetical protein
MDVSAIVRILSLISIRSARKLIEWSSSVVGGNSKYSFVQGQLSPPTTIVSCPKVAHQLPQKLRYIRGLP